MVVHADDLFAEGRAEALLHVDEHLRNMLRINFVSFAITCGTDGWTWTGDPAHSKEPGRELKVGGPKGAATPANDPHSEDDSGRLQNHSMDDSRVQFDTGLVMRGMSTPKVLDRVVRYIAGALGVDWLFRGQGGGETLKLYGLAGVDHAADDGSRCSVS